MGRTRRGLTAAGSVLALVVAAAVAVATPTEPVSATVVNGVDWGSPLAPAGATRVGDAPEADPVSGLFGLTRDQAGLEAEARDVSDPSSPRYGDFSSVTELAERYGPTAAQLDRLEATLEAATAHRIDPTGAFATFEMTVAEAAAFFATSFGLYETRELGPGVLVVLPDSFPGLPAELAGIVTLVRGPVGEVPAGTRPAGPLATPTRTGTPQGCPAALDAQLPSGTPIGLAPNQILSAYGIDALHAAGFTGAGTRVALVEYWGFDQDRLDGFTDCFGIEATTPTVHGPVPPWGVEAQLDTEVLSFVAPDVERLDVFNQAPISLWWEFVPFYSAPLDATRTGGRAPDVVSVSYALCEPAMLLEEFFGGGRGVIEAIDYVLAVGAAAGTAYVAGAGDTGSSGCALLDSALRTQAASYPASSRWALAVGGTNLALDADNAIVAEEVWNDVRFPPPYDSPNAGGGGPSRLWDRPAWQRGPGTVGGPRTTPDVALFADPFPGYLVDLCPSNPDDPLDPPPCPDDVWGTIGGTSAATPLFAGALALLIQQARARSQPRTGFPAPLLYELAQDPDARASVFRDVLVGDNDVYGIGCCSATPGYDQASGWGSLRFARLGDALAAPTAVLAGPSTSAVGEIVTLDAGGSTTAFGELIRYEWDLDGDGSVDTVTAAPEVTTSYASAGARTATVTVVSSLGREAAARHTVAVGPSPPVAAPLRPAFTG